MSEIFVLDPQRSLGRDWAAILHPLSVRVFGRASELQALQRHSVLLVHGAETLALAPRLAERAATVEYFLVVLSGAGFEAPREQAANVYYRRAPVAPASTGADAVLGAAVERFLAQLARTGVPDWRLLEPVLVPEHLAALYLRLHAIARGGLHAERSRLAWNRLSPEDRHNTLSRAWREFVRDGRLNRSVWRDCGLPDLDSKEAAPLDALDLTPESANRACAALQVLLTADSPC